MTDIPTRLIDGELDGAANGAAALEGIAVGASGVAKILIVDDDQATLKALKSVLEDLNQPIVCAQSGEEALRLLLQEEFALILLDVLMPGMDGYEMATYVRSRAKTRHIPIIFLSAVNKDNTHLFHGYSAGAVDYVFKPVEPVIIRSKVSVFVELHKKAVAMRRQAALLDRSLAQQRVIIESLPMALYTASAADGFRSRTFVGGDVEQLCGISSERFAEEAALWESRVHPDDSAAAREAIESIPKNNGLSAEYRWKGADDRYRWFFDRAVVASDGPKGAEGETIYGIWYDVTQRRNLQEQLVHAQKLEVVGQMSGVIAHDFNNMLGVIIGSLDSVLPSVKDDSKLKRRIEISLQAAESCAGFTKRLLGFARRSGIEPRTLRLRDEIMRQEALIERLLGKQIEASIHCAADLSAVRADPSQLEAAIVNLVVNARDAMPEGGSLRIACRNVNGRDVDFEQLDIAPGDYVELAVEDSGQGMTEEVRRHAFDPFFTTKPSGKGTGLGLSSIYEFIRESGGSVAIDSVVGKGTVIRLYLPATVDRAGAADDPGIGSDHATGVAKLKGRTILVVEDESHVRETAVNLLQELGCETLEAADGSSALDVLENHDEVDLVFSDCVMPGDINGVQLAEEITRVRPGLPIVLTTGYDGTKKNISFYAAERPLLAKPYTNRDLVRVLAAQV